MNDTADAVDATPGDGLCAAAGGACSLRAAVMESNALAGEDQILLWAGIHSLDLAEVDGGGQLDEAGDLDVLGDLVVTGAGAHVSIVRAGAIAVPTAESLGDRIFEVHAGVDATLERLTIRGARFFGLTPNSYGAGVANHGTLRLLDGVVQDNLASPADGGGIMNYAGAILVVRRSSILDNYGDDCGGLFNQGTALLENVTVHGNAGYLGGAYCSYGALMILGSTVSENVTDVAPYAAPLYGQATVGGTIIANNGTSCADVDDCLVDCGLTQSLGKNLVETDCPGIAWYPSDLHGAPGAPLDARLAPLAYNGGTTPTHALLPGSPAIDAIAVGGDCLATDQRGVARPQDGDADGTARCDVGAFEADRACANGVDDDGDGAADFPADPGCADADGVTEVGQCQNGRDDDGDGQIDHDGGAAHNGGVAFAPVDPQCAGKPLRKKEAASCGLGAEAAVALAFWRARRRRTAGR